jgi:hypothetical protein
MFFPGEDPIGQRIALTVTGSSATAPDWLAVVGHADGSDPPRSGAGLAPWAGMDRDVPLYRVETLAGRSTNAQWNGRVCRRLWSGGFDVRAGGTARQGGLYAVLAHRVALRNQEIGMRIALPRDDTSFSW